MFNLTPRGVNKSLIVNLRSAIISSPSAADLGIQIVQQVAYLIQPVYTDDTNVTCPAGLIAINALNVLVDL